MPLTGEQLASKRAEVTIPYNGDTCTLVYRTDVVTREFKAETLRLARESFRIERRNRELSESLARVQAVSGTAEADEEDAEAERAIQRLVDDDDEIKRRIDHLVISAVETWDITVSSKDTSMLPIDAEHLFPLPGMFEAALLQGILEHASLGEANAPSSSIRQPLPLKQRAWQETGRQSPNSTQRSKRASGAHR